MLDKFPDDANITSMLKRLATFCVTLLLLATLGAAFHHHDDGADHPDCSICAAIHHQADTGFVAPVIEIQRLVAKTIHLQPALAVVAKLSVLPANGRAPPP